MAGNRDNTTNDNKRPHIPFNWANCKRLAFNVLRQFDDTYYTGFAPQIAYFFFMASIPTLLVLTQILGIFDISLDFIREWLDKYVDPSLSGFVMALFSASNVNFTNVIMIILALWAASSLEFSLKRLNTYVLTDGKFRFSFLEERIRAIPTALVTVTAIAFALIVNVYGEELFKQLVDSVFLLKLFLLLKQPIGIVLFFLMVLLSYYTLTRIRVPIKAVIPGAIIATAGLMLVTTLYALYIENIAHYNILYGSFANIVALLLWFYLVAWVICIGSMANKAWDEVFQCGRLTQNRIIEYVAEQNKRKDIEKLFIEDDDKFNPKTQSFAVKMSCKFEPGYAEELEREKKALDRQRRITQEAHDMYEDYHSE